LHVRQVIRSEEAYPDSPSNPQIDKMAKYIQLSNRYTWMALTANNKRADHTIEQKVPLGRVDMPPST
jgi:hypothetical protein